MAKRCAYTGRGTTTGHNVSHSVRRTKRKFFVNLHKKRFIDPRTGKTFVARVSTRALRTLTKDPKRVLELAKKVVGRIIPAEEPAEKKAA